MMNQIFSLPRRVRILFALAKFQSWKRFNICEFERSLGFFSPQADVRRIIKFLVGENVISLTGTLHGVPYYALNRKALRVLIEELEVTKVVYDYISDNYLVID